MMPQQSAQIGAFILFGLCYLIILALVVLILREAWRADKLRENQRKIDENLLKELSRLGRKIK